MILHFFLLLLKNELNLVICFNKSNTFCTSFIFALVARQVGKQSLLEYLLFTVAFIPIIQNVDLVIPSELIR